MSSLSTTSTSTSTTSTPATLALALASLSPTSWSWFTRLFLLIGLCSATSLYLRNRVLQYVTLRHIANIQRRKAEARHRDEETIRNAANSPFPSSLEEISAMEREIISSSATEIVKRIAAQEKGYSAYDVLLAMSRQALRIDRKCNVLTETRFTAALEEAKLLDEKARKQSSERGSGSLGPLHGLPLSVKDSVGVRGMDCTLGVSQYADQPWPVDALAVDLLQKQGAIIFAKTNIPQTLISFECCNPIFGRSFHLRDARYTPGGSSGGEAALIAGGGSFLGGSLRIPCHFSGLYALKCTSRRFTTVGFRASVPGIETIPGVAGPMANSAKDLALLARHVVHTTAFSVDPHLVPLPWNDSVVMGTNKLTIGYYLQDGVVPMTPACTRAVLETVTALRQRGHTVVEWIPPSTLEAISLYYAIMSADGGHTMTDQLQSDPREDYVTALIIAIRTPIWIKSILAFFLRRVASDNITASIIASAAPSTVNSLWKLQARKRIYADKFWKQFNDANLDVVISPTIAVPAVKHGDFKKASFCALNCMIYNLLDAAAGVAPVSRVESSDTWPPHGSRKLGFLERAVRSIYDPKSSAGMPLAVQVAAPPFHDEMVVRVLGEIESAMPFKRDLFE